MTDSHAASGAGSKLGMNDVCVLVSEGGWNVRLALIQHLYLEENSTQCARMRHSNYTAKLSFN